MMRVLSAEDVRAALPMSAAIEAVQAGFIALSAGRARVPLRGVLETDKGVTLTMPAHIEGSNISTVKVVSVYAGNAAHNLPTIHAAVLVIDAQTGVPLMLLDGRVLTAIRTGAASGVATRWLARADAAVLGVIGAGAQARTQIEAVCAVRNIQQIRLYSRSQPHALAAELRANGHEVIVAASAHEAASVADVIVLATNSKTPVISRADVRAGTHINGVGSFTPQMQEAAADLITAATVIVDHTESVWAEGGDLIIPRDAGLFREQDVYAELGEIAAGHKPARTAHEQITFFKSVGNGVQDAAVAEVLLQEARARGLGVEVAL